MYTSTTKDRYTKEAVSMSNTRNHMGYYYCNKSFVATQQTRREIQIFNHWTNPRMNWFINLAYFSEWKAVYAGTYRSRIGLKHFNLFTLFFKCNAQLKIDDTFKNTQQTPTTQYVRLWNVRRICIFYLNDLVKLKCGVEY